MVQQFVERQFGTPQRVQPFRHIQIVAEIHFYSGSAQIPVFAVLLPGFLKTRPIQIKGDAIYEIQR